MTEDHQEEQQAAEQHAQPGPQDAPLAWFHTHDDWSFARRPDGCVAIDSPGGQIHLDSHAAAHRATAAQPPATPEPAAGDTVHGPDAADPQEYGEPS